MNYFKRLFQGRLNRRNYLISYLTYSIIYVSYLLKLDKIFDNNWSESSVLIVFLLLLLYLASFFIRRLHDIGYTGWFILFIFVPILGIAFPILLIFRSGDKKVNKYGKPPEPKFDFKNLLGI